jgi:hypothetical protein
MLGTPTIKTIELQCFSLSRQRVLEHRLHVLELGPISFTRRLKFRAEEPQPDDDGLPWIEVDNDFTQAYPRKKFAGIEKHWNQHEKLWKILISFDGAPYDLILFFKRQTACEEVFEQLVPYFFNQ